MRPFAFRPNIGVPELIILALLGLRPVVALVVVLAMRKSARRNRDD